MACYLIDTENVKDSFWQGVLCAVQPDDDVYLFYTDFSSMVHMRYLVDLSSVLASAKYVKCFRTDKVGDNSLDFQLVSHLGYLIAGSSFRRESELYFVVSCDGGFDAVVRYWRSNNVRIQRLATDANPNQKLPAGPMMQPDSKLDSVPVAIKPDFSRIMSYGKLIGEVLIGTDYYDFRFEIASVYIQIADCKLSRDKFALAFRNAMARSYGAKNGLYAILKPVFQKIESGELVKAVSPVAAATPAAPAKAAEDSKKQAESSKSASAVKPEPVMDKSRLNSLLASSQHLQNLVAQFDKSLPMGLKGCGKELVMHMMASFDSDISKWRERYDKRIKKAGFDVNTLPSRASTIIPSDWPNAVKSTLKGIRELAEKSAK